MLINLNQFTNTEEPSFAKLDLECKKEYDAFIAIVRKYYSARNMQLTEDREEKIRSDFFLKCHCKNQQKGCDNNSGIDFCLAIR